MDVLTAAVLVAIGIAAGLIASVVGGAAVIVYPAMIAVGIPPQPAAVANIVAIMPGTMLAALADRSQLPKFNRDFIQLIIASIAGAALGAMLLLLTPERTFNVVIPLLLGFATLLLAAFVELSGFSELVNLLAAGALIFFFAAAIAGYSIHGWKRDTEDDSSKVTSSNSGKPDHNERLRAALSSKRRIG